jgi:hypothetical protein
VDLIRRLAWVSIARGCGFGSLAIFTFMIGFISTPAIAFEAGGFGFLMMAVIMIIKAKNAADIRHTKTEIWVMLDVPDRPPSSVAASVIATVRRQVLYQFAMYCALMAVVMLTFALLFLMFGPETEALGVRPPRMR